MTNYDVSRRLEESLRKSFPDAQIMHISETESPKGKEGYAVHFPGINAAPVIYVDDAIKSVTRGIHLDDYTGQLAYGLRTMAAEQERQVVPNLADPERLIAVPAAKGEDVSGIPHRTIPGTDISLYARCMVGRDGEADMSYRVMDQHLALFHMTANEVIERALANTVRDQPLKIQTLSEKMAEMVGIASILGDEPMPVPTAGPELWVVTNERGEYGAAALAMPEVLQQLHERIGEDYYVLPSSRHEFLAIGKSFGESEEDMQSLEDMIKQVNEGEVDAADQLSDNLMFFNGESLSIPLASNTEEMADSLDDIMQQGRSR